jgi:hypothetical protein
MDRLTGYIAIAGKHHGYVSHILHCSKTSQRYQVWSGFGIAAEHLSTD